MRHKKTVVAGRYIRQAIYPAACGQMAPATRAGKVKATSEAMRKLNLRYSYQKLSVILAAGFPQGSNVITLTYDDEHYPKDRKRVEADLKAFRIRMTKAWKRKGKPFRMVWSIEHKHGDGRWHVHAVINAASGNDLPAIQSLWGKGRAETKHLRINREKNHLSLAIYMAKEADDQGNGRHGWHYTRNCPRPEAMIETGLSDSEVLQAPRGAMLIEQESHTNEFGTWQYIAYYIPDDAPARTQRMLKRKSF